jgi:calcineurin-like phosphoesterase family protein/purple acid phosphatase-like protein
MSDTPRQPAAPAGVTRRTLLGATAVGGAASPMLWVPPAASAVPATGVHLAYGADPRRGMGISWSTPGSVRRPRLELGTDRSFGELLRPETRSTMGVDTVYHNVDTRELRAGTRYFYRISHAGSDPVVGSFRTAPRTSRGFRFTTFGDMGVNDAARRHVQMIGERDPDFAFVVGDLCYADKSGGTGIGGPQTQDFTVWDQWYRQIQSSARRIPWMTAVGNHEMEAGNGELGYDGYLARTNLPRNGAAGSPTYSFRFQNVGFVALDGNDASYEITRNAGYTGNRQDAWLEDTLARMRADRRIDFIVAGFHHCMYCTNLVHGSDGGTRTRWEPLFDRYSVDVVVNGHNHSYERTHLMRDGVPVAEAPPGSVVDSRRGTTYLTVGGAGQAEYPAGDLPASYVTEEGGVRVPEGTEWSSRAYLGHSIAFVDVRPRIREGLAGLRITALAKDGSRIDRVTLRR